MCKPIVFFAFSDLKGAIREQLTLLIKEVFGYDAKRAKALLSELMRIVRVRELVTVFRQGETPKQDLDNAILTALLKGQNLMPIEQLTLALAWDRADVARSDIFVMGQASDFIDLILLFYLFAG